MFRRETGFNRDFEKNLLDKDRYLKSHFSYEDRVDQIRSKRVNQEQRFKDERHQFELQRQADMASRRQEHLEHENRIRLEHEKTEHAIRDAKYRQYVRENSTELRDLERKLSAAYVNKIREVQLSEKDYEMARLRAQKYEEAKQIEKEKEIARIERDIENQNKYLHKLKYNENLRTQLEEQTTRNKEAALLQFALDKIMIEEIVQKILEEDQKQYEEELKKRFEFQNDVRMFLLGREQLRAREHEELEREKQKILRYLADRDKKEQQSVEAKKERDRFLQEMQEKLADSLVAARRDRTEEENLRYELDSEEMMERQLAKERREFEERLKSRLQLRHSLETQLLEQAERIKKEKQEDEVFREEMLRQLRLQDKIEQMSNQKRRMKELEHRKAVKELIEERQARRADARKREIEELEELRKSELERQKIIDEERTKILVDHAEKLMGYFPKGTFRDKNELLNLKEILGLNPNTP